LSKSWLLTTRAAKIAGIPITSIIPTTIEENAGLSITRPRRASNHSSRPRTAKAIGVEARATSAAARAIALTGSLAKYSLSLEITDDPFLRAGEAGRVEQRWDRADLAL